MKIIELIIPIIISLLVILEIVGLPLSIVLAIIAANKQDSLEKKKLNRIALWSLFGPPLLMIITLTIWALIKLTTQI